MKRLVLAAALAALSFVPAKADVIDYAELYGGASQDPDLGSPPPNDFEMEVGYNLGGTLGWILSPAFSVELDFFYTDSDFTGFDDSLTAFTGMVDGLYYMDAGSVRPYIGAGAGFAQVTFTDESTNATDSDTVFAYQGMLGMLINVESNIDLILEYRYQGANDASINGLDQEYSSHNLSAGFRFNIS